MRELGSGPLIGPVLVIVFLVAMCSARLRNIQDDIRAICEQVEACEVEQP